MLLGEGGLASQAGTLKELDPPPPPIQGDLLYITVLVGKC